METQPSGIVFTQQTRNKYSKPTNIKFKGYGTVKCGITNTIYVISTSGTTRTDSGGSVMQEQLPRNLYTDNKAKISPSGRNDILLIKLSMLSVIELIENTASHGVAYAFKKAKLNQ